LAHFSSRRYPVESAGRLRPVDVCPDCRLVSNTGSQRLFKAGVGNLSCISRFVIYYYKVRSSRDPSVICILSSRKKAGPGLAAGRQSAGVLGWTKRTQKGEGHSLHLCNLEGPPAFYVQSLQPTPMQMKAPEMEAPEAGWQYCILFWCQL
jgi:hypothetical protein